MSKVDCDCAGGTFVKEADKRNELLELGIPVFFDLDTSLLPGLS